MRAKNWTKLNAIDSGKAAKIPDFLGASLNDWTKTAAGKAMIEKPRRCKNLERK